VPLGSDLPSPTVSRTWKKVVGVNLGLLLGLVCSFFLVPPEMPALWLLLGFVLLAVMFNGAILLRARDSNRAKILSRSGMVIALCTMFFVLDVIFTRGCGHHS